MRTPDKVTFVQVAGGGKYDPRTGTVSKGVESTIDRSCMVQEVSLATQFEQYGTRDKEIVSIILSSPFREPFDHVLVSCNRLEMVDRKYKPLEKNPTHPRTRIRLERFD